MYTLTVKKSFSAAHYLVDYPGDCKRIHGHNYKVTVSIKSKQLNKNGMVWDLIKFQSLLTDCLKPFDHQLLNELELFKGLNPTSENIARLIFKDMTGKIPEHVEVDSVTIHEIDNFCVTYSKE